MSSKSISRRKFLKRAPVAAAGLMTVGSLSGPARSATDALDPRPGIPNPYKTPDNKPILVCVEGTDFQKMLKKGLGILGGLKKLIDDNQDVFIKPNWNATEVYPAISNMSCIRSVVCEAVIATDGAVAVGDQGFQHNSVVYANLGAEGPITSAGATLEALNETYQVRAPYWDVDIPNHLVYSKIYDAPVLISTCCVKRHYLSTLSCALKNNVGAVAGAQATGTRAYLHQKSGNAAQEVCSDIAAVVNPDLTIVDARAVLTVSGPFSGDGVTEMANKIVICGDMVATDTYCAQIMADHDSGFDPSMISAMLDRAVFAGLGTSNLSEVEIIETTES